MMNSRRKLKYYEVLQDEDTYTTVSSSYAYDEKMVAKKIRWILFSDNNWVRKWDLMMLILIFFMMIAVPYQVGVSVGYYLVHNDMWFALNVIIDSLFFIDTFLPFWRSYHDDRGRLIINRKRICQNYLRTSFFINFISSFFPSATYRIAVKRFSENDVFLSNGESSTSGGPTFEAKKLIFLSVSILKFIRFHRANKILTSSKAVRKFLESKYMDPYWLTVMRNMFYLFVVSHWFACLWSFVAFFQCGTFLEKAKYKETWMSLWHNNTIENTYYKDKDMLHPFGWKNDMDRYILSLFWAIQTISSIGYGNISPHTFIERLINSILMLFAGVLWAIMIGSLISSVKSMSTHSISKARLIEAHQLVRAFRTTEQDGQLASNVGKRVKNFILDQQERNHLFRKCNLRVVDELNIYDNLSLELRRMSSYMIYGKYLNSTPYFSSRHLDVQEQSHLILNCQLRCFAAGEQITINHKDTDDKRGLFIIIEGFAFLKFYNYKQVESFFYLRKGASYGCSQVLVDREEANLPDDRLLFPVYTRVLFLSRSVVLDAMKRNRQIWRDCARWKYFQCLVINNLRKRNERRMRFRYRKKSASFLF